MTLEDTYEKQEQTSSLSLWGKWRAARNFQISDTSTQEYVGAADTFTLEGNAGVVGVHYATATVITAVPEETIPTGVIRDRSREVPFIGRILEHLRTTDIEEKSDILDKYETKNEEEVRIFLEQHPSLKDYLAQVAYATERRFKRGYNALVLELRHTSDPGETVDYLEIGIKTTLDPVETVEILQEVFDDIEENQIDSSLIAITCFFE